MRKSKQFLNMPVISLEEGTQVGTIKGLVINPGEKKVAALLVDQKGWFNDQKFIPYGSINSVGEDAVTVSRSAAIQKGVNLPEIISLVKQKSAVSGARIITEDGTILGTIDDYYVNLASGDLVGLEFSGGYLSGVYNGTAFLDTDHILTIGKEMIVCTNEAVDKVIKLDGGLQDKIRGVKETTGKLVDSTVQKSKNFSSTLGTSVSKSITKIKRNKETPKEKPGDDDDIGQEKQDDPPPGAP